MKGIWPRTRDTGRILGYSELEKMAMDSRARNGKLVLYLSSQLFLDASPLNIEMEQDSDTCSDPFTIVHTCVWTNEGLCVRISWIKLKTLKFSGIIYQIKGENIPFNILLINYCYLFIVLYFHGICSSNMG